VDAVDISVPTGLHKELICRAIQRNLHVYTEKPMCRSVEEADEIVEMNSRLKKIIFVGYNLRFCREFLGVKEVLASGELGEVRHVWIQRGAWLDPDSYVFNADWHAGIITELSSHALDLLRWWGFTDVERVYAQGTNVFGHYPDPDTVSLSIKFRSGTTAAITNSYAMPGIATEVCILGSRKMLRARYGKCWVQPYPRRWSIPGLLRIAFREAVIYPYRILYNPFQGSCAHFVHCIRTGQRSGLDEVEGRESVRLASMLQESYSKGQVVAPVPGGGALFPAVVP
jgi:predicted dehydrogenase